MKIRLEFCEGVEGPSIYLDDTRIAGPKPWGGGTVTHSWLVDIEGIEEVLTIFRKHKRGKREHEKALADAPGEKQ